MRICNTYIELQGCKNLTVRQILCQEKTLQWFLNCSRMFACYFQTLLWSSICTGKRKVIWVKHTWHVGLLWVSIGLWLIIRSIFRIIIIISKHQILSFKILGKIIFEQELLRFFCYFLIFFVWAAILHVMCICGGIRGT